MHLITPSIPLFSPYNLTIPYALHAVYLTQTQRSPFQEEIMLPPWPPQWRLESAVQSLKYQPTPAES